MAKKEIIASDEQTTPESTITISEEDFYQTLRSYVIDAQKKIYAAVNAAMVTAYWKIGHDIHEALARMIEHLMGRNYCSLLLIG